MSKMNPAVKAKWVAALRSGEYEQTHGDLRKRGAFCCLGVLCELHRIEVGGEWGGGGYGPSSYNRSLGTPGKDVVEWAGLPEDNPKVSIGETCGVAAHNDGDPAKKLPARTFSEIADAIEAQL